MMARIRTVKPEFWSSEQVMSCRPMARLLFIGIWNFCDDGGNHPLAPRTIKALIFPGDDISSDEVAQLLLELMDNDLLQTYVVDGKTYIHVRGWKHQKIEKKNFKYPEFPGQVDDQLSNGSGAVVEESSNGRRPVDPGRDVDVDVELEGKGEEHVDADAPTPEASKAQGENIFPIDRIPYEKIRELYNSILGGKLKRCMGLNDTHRKHIRAAQNLQLEGRFVVREGGLDFWEGLFNDVLSCPFMLGSNNRSWRADFEFLTTGTKIQRFLEGKYDAA